MPLTESNRSCFQYFYDVILFKFVRDYHGLYGSDEFAMKAASCEMRGLNHVLAADPLVIQYHSRHNELSCSSVLPYTLHIGASPLSSHGAAGLRGLSSTCSQPSAHLFKYAGEW